ncbi:leucine-rich repeat extensin-like protein 6 [Solanum dulcamara]|uniref:leucine-rich repeat extensin-like protein 6 n=1 Tax=Solanum dulcamara TaxID=45834 RepID=UPI002486370F|nr:leucine-rich repeat extensin-like protein 6 [Solanum dulcamara]
MATGSSRPPPKTYDLEITIVSAKHLKNVNWRHGDLKPYVIFWVDPDQRRATQADDSGNTRPVWNERFLLHLPQSQSPHDSVLTLEIFHSKPSETPKPLVGTLRVSLKELVNVDDYNKIRTFELRRPSGRPHGKIRLKLAIRESPTQDYQIPPPSSYYYSTAPPPPPSYRTFPSSPYTSHPPPPPPVVAPPPPASPSPPPPPPAQSYPYGGYTDPYSSYYPGYYSQPPPPPRPFVERQSSYGSLGSRPSAPVDYYPPYDHKRSGKMGMGVGVGTGLAVGAVAGTLGGMTLGEGLKYEEGKIAGRVENNIASRDDYSNYSVEY